MLIPQKCCREDFWCLTTYFNPVHYKSRLRNHNIFVESLAKQNVNLCVIECAFGNDAFELDDASNLIRLRAKSILWQKERMLNHALSLLPPSCKYIAWVDGDVLFPTPDWPQMTINLIDKGNDVIQLFDRVEHLPPGESKFSGKSIMSERSLVWQSKIWPNFIEMRKKCELLYATTGFAWAAPRRIFDEAGGFYDKHCLGANDNIIIDCCLNTFDLHHYYRAGKGTPVLNDMMDWAANKFGKHTAHYLPLTIYHLFHGAKKNRGYLTREDIIKKHQYDPNKDITVINNVYEWASNKPQLHQEVKDYFSSRCEDSDMV